MDARSRQIAKLFEGPVLVAALLVIPLLVLEQTATREPWTTFADVLNWSTWLIFLAELVVMLLVVPERGRWLRDHPVDVVAVVLSPPVLPAGLAAARLLRLLRVLRLLRLAPMVRRLFTLDGLRYAALLAFVTVLAGGTAFAEIEKGKGEWDGIWWAVTTMTTVGYGDIYPHTNGGRIIAIVVMVVGIAFASLLFGAVAQRFLGPEVEQVEEEAERIEAVEEDVLAQVRDISARLSELEAALQRNR